MNATAKQVGTAFEKLAGAFLLGQGLKIICTNYHAPRLGEIDIVASQEQNGCPVLVFVEVRARRGGQFGGAIASITKTKQARLIQAGEHFLQHHEQFADWACRFDVLAFDGNDEPQWIQSAFWADF